jgi:hypothetical protein
MSKENSSLVQPSMRCGNEIEITLNPDEIFKEEVLAFDIDEKNNYFDNQTSVNFIIVILLLLILRDKSMEIF